MVVFCKIEPPYMIQSSSYPSVKNPEFSHRPPRFLIFIALLNMIDFCFFEKYERRFSKGVFGVGLGEVGERTLARFLGWDLGESCCCVCRFAWDRR